eukprot:m.326553 g.326553  ORF g.326553 m.326553 type:complete len:1341 (-) comp19743_c0_seq1:120-4142(-)
MDRLGFLPQQCAQAWKVVQRAVLSFVATRFGAAVCVIGGFLVVISALQLGESAIDWSRAKYRSGFSVYTDNLAGKSFQDRLCSPTPVDIVYTWVNGSDPLLQSELAKVKRRLELEKNRTKAKALAQKANRTAHGGNHSHGSASTTPSAHASHATEKAIVGPFWVVTNDRLFTTSTLHDVPRVTQDGGKEDRVAAAVHGQCGNGSIVMLDVHEVAAIIEFPTVEAASACKKKTLTVDGHNFTLAAAKSYGNITLDGLVPLHSDLGLGSGFGFAASEYRKAMVVNLPADVPEELLVDAIGARDHVEDFRFLADKGTAIVTFETRWPLIELVDQGNLTFFHDRLDDVWVHGGVEDASDFTVYNCPVVSVTSVGPISGATASVVARARNNSMGSDHAGDEQDEVSSSRFQDNSELQYSLRSIEKHAPWVRHIYIVTNGQIPAWLDLDHPRISVVTHEDIFANKSHLPTFSSPAIESHLHRIPGLSEQFLYLNDDVMFGTPVWPDDFYTAAKGQKVFLAWPVPNCAEGCPSNWIGDKYCDAACNTTECDYDGGDCLGKAQPQQSNNFHHAWDSNSNTQSTNAQPCTAGCTDSWIGDKYCDRACNVKECGFDGADCGLDLVLDRLPGFEVTHVNQTLRQDKLVDGAYPRAIYVNVSKLTGNQTVKEGSYNNSDAVVTSVYSREFDLLTIVLRPRANQSKAAFGLSFDGPNGTTVLRSFFMDLRTKEPEGKEAAALAVKGLNASSVNATNATNATIVTRVYTDGITLPPPLPRAKKEEGPTIRVMYPKRKKLPSDVLQHLEALELELAEGDLTQKGFARFSFELLTPYNHLLEDDDEQQAAGNEHAALADEGTAGKGQGAAAAVDDGGANTDGKGQGAAAAADDAGANQGDARRRLLAVSASGKQHVLTTANSSSKVLGDDVTSAWLRRSEAKQLRLKEELASSVHQWEQQRPSAHNSRGATERVPRQRRWDSQAHAALLSDHRNTFKWERSIGVEPGADDVQRMDDEPSFRPRGSRRHLLDTFGDSLKHVNSLYNKKFGFEARKVVAHMPHYLDRSILDQLEADFPEEWAETSSHQLRSSTDMQFAFSYMYYMMSLERPFDLTEEFKRMDVDGDGVLTVHELRTLVTRIYPLPTTLEHWQEFEQTLLDCAHYQPPMYTLGVGVGPDAVEVWVSEQMIASCEPLLKKILEYSGKKKRYKHEIIPEDQQEVAFLMVRNNATNVQTDLDGLRKDPKKFICLNDNIDHRKASAADVVRVIQDFYQSLFPLRSQFELGEGYRNRFLHVKDLREWKNKQKRVLEWSRYALALVLTLLAFALCSGKLHQLKRMWQQRRHRQRTAATATSNTSG